MRMMNYLTRKRTRTKMRKKMMMMMMIKMMTQTKGNLMMYLTRTHP